jgi:hypothetical protein
MDSRPWTPPEIEDDSPSRPGYFNLFGTSPPKYPSSETEQRWLREANRSMSQPLFNRTFKLDTPTRVNPQSRPKPVSTLTEPAPAPYTPTPHSQGALRYPYTPDSSQILRRTAALPATPTPWDDDESEDESASPVQNALSSCIAHFENLIHTHQPDEDQMEYIVGQFEAMAAHLSGTPSKDSDDDRFQDATSENGDAQTALLQEKMLHHEAYVAEVGNYVAGVQKYIDDLKMRMDEVKTLNSIQQDVINDLRTQMKIVRQGMHDSLHSSSHIDNTTDPTDLSLSLSPSNTSASTSLTDALQYNHQHVQDGEEEAAWETIEDSELSREIHAEYSKLLRTTVHNLTADPPAPPRRRVITIVRKPQRRSFWASFGEALDEMADVLDEQ